MDLVDVENDLRAHLHRQATPPAPEGLVERTRALHRQRRRTQAGVVAAGVAVALLFGGVPALRAALPLPDRSDVAAPPTAAPSLDPLASLFDLPVRGPLAGDTDWLAAVAALPWESDGPGPLPDTRRVAWAGDVGTERIAMLLGRGNAEAPLVVWFTGPAGAAPEQMVQATAMNQVTERAPQAFLDVPAVGSDSAVLVVVGRPGDEFELHEGTVVDADGVESPVTRLLPADDAVAVTDGVRSLGWWGGPLVQVVRNGRDGETVYPTTTAAADQTARSPSPFSDPRGLAPRLDESRVQDLLWGMTGHYGTAAGQATPVLLAGGRLGQDDAVQVAMAGTTLPSGATTAWVSVTRERDTTTTTGSTVHAYAAPATPLLDQVLSMAVDGFLAVSGPVGGVSAEVREPSGTTLTTMPLAAGAGVAELAPPAGSTVRVLDGAGRTLAEAPLLGLTG